MNIGIKIWSTNLKIIKGLNKLLSQNEIAYVEVYAVTGSYEKTISNLKQINGKKIIHCPHLTHSGFNIADATKIKQNIDIFKETQKFADDLNAEYIIVHAGDEGDAQSAIDFLDTISDKRIIIENMPRIGINGENCIGYDMTTLKPYSKFVQGFCIDLSHAVKAACSLNKNYKDLINELTCMQIKMFHISDGFSNNPKDEHLNFGEGNMEIGFFLHIIKEKMFTLETSRKNHDNIAEDLRNISYLKNIKNEYTCNNSSKNRINKITK